MLELCQKHPRTLAFVNEEHGPEFSRAVLQKNAEALPYVSSEFIEQSKTFVLEQLKNFRKKIFHNGWNYGLELLTILETILASALLGSMLDCH